MKPALNLWLVTSTSCNVRCKTCPVGRKEFEPGGMMKLEMARRILEKATRESRVLNVQCHHYNEPMLVPWIADIIKACHDYGCEVLISSNLVNFKNVPASLEQAPETFLISTSGFTQPIYERSHKDGDIEKVKANMYQVSRLRKPGTYVQVNWHRYRYNAHEEPLMRAYAEQLGFAFVPYITSLLPHDGALRQWATGIADPNGEDCLYPVMDAKQACFDRRKWPCIHQDQVIAVNSDGDYLNCGHRNGADNLMGDFFATTVPEILKARKTNAACLACRSVGGHVYASFQYGRAEWSPLRIAEVWYRKLGLAGRFPGFSNWATHKFYIRPQQKETL